MSWQLSIFQSILIKFSPHIEVYGLYESDDILNEVIWTFSKHLHLKSSSRNRFCIHIVDSTDQERHSLKGSVKSTWKHFSESSYPTKDLYQRKKQLLEFIVSCFLEVASDLNWSVPSIQIAYQESLKDGIQFTYSSIPKLNKTRTTSAAVEFCLSMNKVSISVHFVNVNSKEVSRKHLMDTFEHQVSFFKCFDMCKWVDNESYGFVFKGGMTVSVSSNREEPCWSAIIGPEQQYVYNMLNYRTEIAPEDLAKWVNF